MNTTRINALPPRNKGSYLDKCQKTNLLSNLFKVDLKENIKIYIYSVKTDPEIPQENGKKFRSMMGANRNNIERLVGQYVISGRTIFGTKLQSTGKEEYSTCINFQSERFTVFLKVAKEIALTDINSPCKEKSGAVYCFLNNMVRNFFHQMQYTEIGKSKKYFDPSSRKTLDGANVTIYKGYSSNFTLLENGLFLKIDPTVKIIQSDSALDVINNIYKLNSTKCKTEKRLLVQEELIGKMVMANYGKNRCYRIESILFDTTLETFQFTHNNKTVNILEYYSQTYDIMIQAKKQPLIKAQTDRNCSTDSSKDVILIPELVLMSGLPDDFDERKRREISQTTIVNPSQKLSEIQNMFSKINSADNDFNPQTISQKLGIKFNKTPTSISGKQLQYPELLLGDKQKIDEHKATNFMLFNKYLYNRDVALKLYIFYPANFDFGSIKKLLESTCSNLGLQFKIATSSINYNDSRSVLKNIENIVNSENEGKTSNMFWFIIPPNFKSQYKTLKRMTLKEGLQVNSQVTVATNLQKKGFQSIFTKVLLQMAAKLGNKLWVPKVSQKIHSTGVILIALQTTKDSEFKNKNIISYCCNTSKEFSTFHSNYIYDDTNTLKTYMKDIIFDCLNEYMMRNQTPPNEVIILKNGTVKMDLTTLIQAEVVDVKEILKSVSKSNDPIRLTYIILDKNTSQKFFSSKGRDVINPSSGTLVNSEAVGKNFEFYLIAQQCNRGTVKPTYYKVAYCDSTLEEGVIEELIYNQCFNYMNWTGSIKVPSMLQYAKKLGSFIGQYINRQSKFQNLQRHLYYI